MAGRRSTTTPSGVAGQIEYWTNQNGKQSGDPAKLARALLTVASEEPPRRRFIAGADSIGSTEQKVAELQADIALNRERFISLDVDEAGVADVGSKVIGPRSTDGEGAATAP